MFEFGHLFFLFVIYAQTYPQKLWIENGLLELHDPDTGHAELTAW